MARYQTKYYYDIWRWVFSRNASASGKDHQPYWPDTQLTDNEREGRRSEQYCFSVQDKKGTVSVYRLSEAEWLKLEPGDTVNITARRTGGEPYLSDQKGNKIADIVPVK